MPQASIILSTLIPLEAFLAFLFGGSFIWAQRLFHFLPIPLSFITIYYFVSQLTPSRLARFLTAFMYAGNHFMVAEFAGGFEGNLYIPALLPILVLLLYRLYHRSLQGVPLQRPLLQYSALLTLAYILSDHVLILLVPFWLTFIVSPLFTLTATRFRYVIQNFLILSISCALVLFLSAYHAYGYFKIAVPFLSGQTLSADLVPFFIQNLWDTYWRMTFGNTLRLGGSYFSDFYLGDDLWSRVGFVIPFLAFSWMIFKKNRSGFRFRLGILFSSLSLFTAIFIFLTGQGVTHEIFKALPFLFRFRNPSRLSLFLSFLYSPLIALTLDSWFDFVSNIWQRRQWFFFFSLSFITFALAVSLVYYQKGFFSGDFTLRQHRGDSFYISERYYRLAEFLDEEHKRKGTFRTAFFPWNHEDAEMKLFWLEPYALGVPIEYGAYIQNEYLDFIKETYKRVAEDKTERFGDFLTQGGVAYVVINSGDKSFGKTEYFYTYHVPWLLGSFDDAHRIISSAKDLKFIRDVDGFKRYQTTKFDPRRFD